MLPLLERVSKAAAGGPLIGLHLRSGFADWQWYSLTHTPERSATGQTTGRVRANNAWTTALQVRSSASRPLDRWAAAPCPAPYR